MHFNIFEDQAFSLASLTDAINDLPHVPGRLGQLGLFVEKPVSTTTVSIERVGQTLQLVPSAPRGASGQQGTRDKRTLRALNLIHLPQEDVVIADEIQNLRAFGSESEVVTLQNLINERIANLKLNLDITIEHQRIGAVKGQVVDADGVTVLHDMFDTFGVTQNALSFELDDDDTKVKQKCIDLARSIETELGGIQSSGVRVLCSPEFFDAFVSHPAVEDAYDRYLDGQFKRESQRKTGFWFADTYFEEYRGQVGNYRFIEAGDAYAVPEGVAGGLFTTFYGPADHMDTVNTLGKPYYAWQRLNDRNTAAIIETQSNPLHVCKRPRAVPKLTIH